MLHHEIVQHDDTRQPLQTLEDRVVVLFIVAQVVNYRVELPGDRLHVHIVFDDTNADVFNLVRLMLGVPLIEDRNIKIVFQMFDNGLRHEAGAACRMKRRKECKLHCSASIKILSGL